MFENILPAITGPMMVAINSAVAAGSYYGAIALLDRYYYHRDTQPSQQEDVKQYSREDNIANYVKRGDLQALKSLHDSGYKMDEFLNEDGNPLAFLAAHDHQIEILKWLREIGVDIGKAPETGFNTGLTLSHFVAENKCMMALGYMLKEKIFHNEAAKFGANVGYTPAMLAAEALNNVGLDIMVKKDIDLNAEVVFKDYNKASGFKLVKPTEYLRQEGKVRYAELLEKYILRSESKQER